MLIIIIFFWLITGKFLLNTMMLTRAFLHFTKVDTKITSLIVFSVFSLQGYLCNIHI